MSRQRGAALVLVLWLIALMTALVGAFALSARVEHLQQRVLDDDARGQERARAGLEYALLRLSADPQRAPWRADGRTYRWQFDDASIEIKVLDENGKINLNLADAALLTAFLKALGLFQRVQGEGMELHRLRIIHPHEAAEHNKSIQLRPAL